jgi:hypothetical protein
MYFIVNFYQKDETVLINAKDENHAYELFKGVYKTEDFTVKKVNVIITYTPEGRTVVNIVDEE